MSSQETGVGYLAINQDTVFRFMLNQLTDFNFGGALEDEAFEDFQEDLEAMMEIAQEAGIDEGYFVLRLISTLSGNWVGLKYSYAVVDEETLDIDEFVELDAGSQDTQHKLDETSPSNPTFDLPVEALAWPRSYTTLLNQGTDFTPYLLKRPQ